MQNRDPPGKTPVIAPVLGALIFPTLFTGVTPDDPNRFGMAVGVLGGVGR